LNNNEIKNCVDLCLSKELICDDIHSQVGLSVDFVLKSSLIRQTLDNITCVMLFFEGFEKIFNEHKGIYSGVIDKSQLQFNDKYNNQKLLEKDKSKLPEKSTKNNSSSQQINEDKTENKDSRKIKTANGMVKKTSILLNKNSAMASSMVSNEIKEKEKSNSNKQYEQSMGGMTSTNFPYTKNLSSTSKQNSKSNYEEAYNNKISSQLNESLPNNPSTTKNSKSKNIGFFEINKK